MKPIILDIIIIGLHIIFCEYYLWYIKHKFGMRSSISASADNIMIADRSPLYFLFMTIGMALPLMYVGESYPMIVSGMMLAGVGVVTGYNKILNPKKDRDNRTIQDTVHVVLVIGGIGFLVLGIILANLWYIPLVVIAAIPITYMQVKKVHCRTWKSEVVMIWLARVYLVIDKVVLPLIEK